MDKNIKIKCRGTASVPINKLVDFQGNLKKLKSDEYAKLKLSIMKYGFRFPVFVWGKNIIDGHQRVYTVKKMLSEGYKISGNIPVVSIQAKDRAEAKKLLLIYNSRYGQVTQEGFIEFLKDSDIDFADISGELVYPEIDLNLIDGILNPNETNNDNDIPEVVPARTQPGDLIIMNGHRLLCGDCTDKKHIETLMAGSRADMVFTDPPYGVNYTSKNRFLNNGAGNRIEADIKNDTLSVEGCHDLWQACFKNISDVFNDNFCYYLFAPQAIVLLSIFAEAMLDNNMQIKNMIIWSKNNHTVGNTDYNYKHEILLYGRSKEYKFHGNGTQKFSVWNFDRVQAANGGQDLISIMERSAQGSKIDGNKFTLFWHETAGKNAITSARSGD